MRLAFPGAEAPRAWSQGCGLRGLLENILGGHCGFCTGRGRVLGHQWVGGTLQLIPGLVPAKFPVLPYLHTFALSGPFRTTLENFCIGCLLGPAVIVESGTVHVSPLLLCPSLHAPCCVTLTSLLVVRG